jgi:hypothetical protein
VPMRAIVDLGGQIVSVFDEAYTELGAVPVAEWPLWLDSHEVIASRFHWWLALLERLEADLKRLALGPEADFVEVADFVVNILDFAVASGAWRPPYAGGMLCRYSLSVADSPFLYSVRLSVDLTVDGAARRTLESFELSPLETVAVARLAEAEAASLLIERDWRSLQDIQWALPELKKLLGRVRDDDIARRIQEWLAVEEQLSEVA